MSRERERERIEMEEGKGRKQEEGSGEGEVEGKRWQGERIEAMCMRLIDNHRQVVSSRKGCGGYICEVSSERTVSKRRSIISRQSKSEIARPFPRATRAAIIGIKPGVNKFRIASNPIYLSISLLDESRSNFSSSLVESRRNDRKIVHNPFFVLESDSKETQ